MFSKEVWQMNHPDERYLLDADDVDWVEVMKADIKKGQEEIWAKQYPPAGKGGLKAPKDI